MGAYDWIKKGSGGGLGLSRSLNEGLPLVVTLDFDACYLAGGLAVRQA